MSSEEPGNGPDELHRYLEGRVERAEADVERLRDELHRMRTNLDTGLLREQALLEHVDALLRRLLRSSGAQALLKGRKTLRNLPDELFLKLGLSFVLFTPAYPNPLLTAMHGIGTLDPPHQKALMLVSDAVRSRLDMGEFVEGSNAAYEAIQIPQHVGGAMGARFIAACLVDPPRKSAQKANDVIKTVGKETSDKALSQHLLPFHIDYGMAILTEVLVAMRAWFKHFGEAMSMPRVQLELARTLLLEIARTRTLEKQFLDALSLQARLAHLNDRDTFNRALLYIGQGDWVINRFAETGLLEADLESFKGDCLKRSEHGGPRQVDLDKLERNLDEFHRLHTELQLTRLELRIKRQSEKKRASALHFRRLVFLAAHHRTSEF